MLTKSEEYCASLAAWVVVNTQPHRERLALEHLGRQQFTAYCPMIRRRVRHARYTQDVLRPLFPNYLFVRVDPDLQRWRSILSTIGVRTLVRCGQTLSFLEDSFVQALKAREVNGSITRPINAYQIGQQIRLQAGAFDGLVATIIEMDEKDRLVVLLDLLNRPVRVKVDANRVSAL